MRKIFSLKALLLSFLLISSINLRASHIAGGDLTVQHLGGCNYVVTLNLLRDCSGITMSSSELVTVTNNCTGGSLSLSLPLVNGTSGTEISQVCPNQVFNSTCNGGSLPGMQQYTYKDTVCLDSTCNNLELSWTTCCRNGAIINIDTPDSEDIIINAVYNPSSSLNNSTPVFTAQPIPYVCINQVVNYNHGVVEADGDSLVFSLVPTLGTSITYSPGYSGALPIPGITINPTNGQLNFTPNLLGNFVIVLQVQEYRNGVLISTVRRDIQIVVINCANSLPNPNGGVISNLITQGSAFQTAPYSIQMCENSSFSFNASFTDSDPGDSLSFSSNISQVLPGAVITSSGTNPLQLNVSWQAPIGSAGTNTTFFININDQSCPILGIQTFVYNINVLQRTSTNPNFGICQGSSATLIAQGGTSFTWSLLNGATVGSGSSFVVSPTVTTTYVVTSNLSSSCINKDTVTVTVAPTFSLSASPAGQTFCSQQPVQFNAGTSTPGNYTYQWAPSTGLNNISISNPIANLQVPGTYLYVVTATNTLGCTRQDSVFFIISPFQAPQVTASANPACPGDSVQLSALLSSFVPTICAIDATPCNSPQQTVEFNSGTLENQATTWPAPYGNFYKNARHQFLYRASDLQAAGFTGGKITSLGFNVTNLNASTLLYRSYTIKLGCTSQIQLGNFFEPNLNQVYDPKDYNVSVGWNDHVFDRAYNWDGFSNLIVEVCFNNLVDPNYTQNVSTLYTATNYNACLFFISDIDPACPATNATGNNGLPNIRFGYCFTQPPAGTFSVNWTPSTFLINPNSYNPVVIPGSTDSVFTVVVTNIAGGCSDSDTALVQFSNSLSAQITQVTTQFCVNQGLQQISTLQPGGIWSGPFISASGFFNPGASGPGTFTLVYSIGGSSGCSDSDSIDIVVSPAPVAGINPPASTNFCASDAGVQLSAINSGGSWVGPGVNSSGFFSPSLAGPGSHIIQYIIPQPCPDSAFVIMQVENAPLVNIVPVPNQCADFPAVILSANAIPSVPGIWQGPGVNSAASTFSPQQAGAGVHLITYSVTDPNSNCTTVDSINIIVNQAPVPLITQIGFNLQTSTPANAYQWSFNGTPIPGATSSTYFPTQVGSYTVTITDANGCEATSQPFFVTITGFSDEGFSNAFRVFPNPARDEISIEIPASRASSCIELVHISGQVVKQFMLSAADKNQVQHLRISDCSAGVYFVRCTGDGASLVRKLIIE